MESCPINLFFSFLVEKCCSLRSVREGVQKMPLLSAHADEVQRPSLLTKKCKSRKITLFSISSVVSVFSVCWKIKPVGLSFRVQR